MNPKVFALLASAFVCQNALAAPYPFTVEEEVAISDYAFIDSDGSVTLSGVVTWTPSMNNFSFDIGATPTYAIYATVTSFHGAGNYNTLADSDPYSLPQSISWTVASGQIGFEGTFSFNGNDTDFVMVLDRMPNGVYTAADADGDGVNGFRLVNGAFQGINFAVNVTTVPEPETWGFMLAGLGFVGWAAQRRNR